MKAHLWACIARDAKGKTWCIESTDPRRMMEDAWRMHAVAITLLRQRQCGKLPSLENVRRSSATNLSTGARRRSGNGNRSQTKQPKGESDDTAKSSSRNP